jgi:hypothetical protein
VVVDEATLLIGELVETYDVVRTVGSVEADFPECSGPGGKAIRLVPARGVPLTFLLTEFPGVVVRFGDWGEEVFPTCGCDACDENPAGLIDALREAVGAAVEGGYEEALTRRALRRSSNRGRSSGVSHLGFGEWRRFGERGVHTWPPWPKR